MLALIRDISLLAVGGLIGFIFSYWQWRLSIAKIESDRRREKLELLHEELMRYAQLVRRVVHKRHYAGLHYPDVGPDPMPRITMLSRLYAPEIRPLVTEMLGVYETDIESKLQPAFSAVDPILEKIQRMQEIIRGRIERKQQD
jgi:hypothetical protein